MLAEIFTRYKRRGSKILRPEVLSSLLFQVTCTVFQT